MLNNRGIKGSFFVTGKFLANKSLSGTLRKLIQEGHYVGPHSDAHLLYAPWDNRDSLLVNKALFIQDLELNMAKIRVLGEQDQRMFIPPYEWYNSTIVKWSNDMGYDVYNFTPGIRTAADYTYPEMGHRYMSSDAIEKQLYSVEETSSLNGAVILVHIGTDSRRKDKFYNRLDQVIDSLEAKGYKFVLLDKI